VNKLITKFCASLLTVLLLINSPCVLALDFDFGFKTGFESFEWEEFDRNDKSLLTETGTRFIVGAFIGNTTQLKDGFIYNAEIQNYFGVVDYDGQTQDGVPVTTDTTYIGGNLIGEAGGRIVNSCTNLAWDFVGMVDIDTWTRNLASNTDATGLRTGEAEEKYMILNVRIGTGPAWDAGNWKGRFIVGIKQPIYTYEFLDNSFTGFTEDITLEPKGRSSAFLTFNNDIQLTKTLHLKIDAYYDSYRFDRSDGKIAIESSTRDRFIVSQPKSYQDTYGIVAGLGWKF